MGLSERLGTNHSCYSSFEELEAHFGPDDDAGVSGVHGHGRPGADLPVPRGTPPLRVLQRPTPRLPAVRPRAHERQK